MDDPKLHTLFLDPKKPDKFSMARVVAFILTLAAITAAFTLDDAVIVLELLTAATACLGVRSRLKDSN